MEVNGKVICRILKNIRNLIANENNISYISAECKNDGPCLGTCPLCDSEIRYIQSELNKIEQSGKTIIIPLIDPLNISFIDWTNVEDEELVEKY